MAYIKLNKTESKGINIYRIVTEFALFTFILMTIYESTKQYLLPDISIWESHTITIGFSTFIVTIASYFVIRKIKSLHNKLLEENKSKKRTETKLIEFAKNLESMVDERTLELTKVNNDLKKEIAQREKIEQSLKQSEEKYRYIFFHSPIGIFQFNTNCQITAMNDKLVEMLDSTKDKLTMLDLRKVNDTAILPAIENALNGTDGYYSGSYFSTTSSAFGYITMNTKTAYGPRGEIIGGIATVQDITEQTRKQLELENAKENAEQSERLKTEFLAQMSHEIRTPISSISNFSQLIRESIEENNTKELYGFLDIIDKSTSRVIRTIELLLNMAELQVGTYKYNPTEFNLIEKIIKPLVKEYDPVARSKSLSLELRNDNGIDQIKADQYSLSQVFANLIDNAVKFTDKGKIIVRVARDDEYQFVQIVDTGIGISQQYLSNLFQPFTQEDSGYSRKYEGNGLGLALVKKYCDINSAKISVKSEKGEGSVFTVNIPIN